MKLIQAFIVAFLLTVAVEAIDSTFSGAIREWTNGRPLVSFAIAATICSYIAQCLSGNTMNIFSKIEYVISNFFVFLILANLLENVLVGTINPANYEHMIIVIFGGIFGFLIRSIIPDF